MKAHRSGKHPATGIALALISLLLLGGLPIISDRKPDSFDALVFAGYVSLWQLVCSTPGFLLERRGRASRPPGEFTRLPAQRRLAVLMIATGVMFGLATAMYIQGVDRAGAVSFAIALQAYPVLAILWETLFLGRGKSRPELFFTAVMIAALYVAGTEGRWTIEGFSPWFLFALGVPLLWSVAHVTLKEVIDATGITPSQIVFSRLLISTIFLWAAALIAGGPHDLVAALGDRRFQAFAVVMGVVYYLELINWFYAVRHIDVSLASSITAPAPIVTMLIAAVFLGDSVEMYQIVVMTVVVASLLGLIRAGSRSRMNAARTIEVGIDAPVGSANL